MKFFACALWHLAALYTLHLVAAPSVAVPSLLLVLQSGMLNSLRNPTVGPEQFRRTLKTHLFVCLLLAFRWQCVRGVLTYSRYTMYIYLLTYLHTYLILRIRILRILKILKIREFFPNFKMPTNFKNKIHSADIIYEI